jgi:hypothetical protein
MQCLVYGLIRIVCNCAYLNVIKKYQECGNFTLHHLNEKKILKAVKTVSDNVETAHLFV